ncbi:NB-ARC domain-containing protein [Moorena sp. SIO3H5]|uniref:NB-ARC domain-containing protein n=1 Tax=Moorena sp. SIO3H5 TaxID=2607834 RepID=UPI0013BAA668|nr:NB-ARC domain-containing protein [Moorena sp. SIO3H5]NEO69397.1 hypothetical protein [Moorena sp. SIO3H5]
MLLSQETARAGTLVVSAIYGLGGIGKSTLAAALAHDPEVQSYFTDGIFWATLGQQPDILSFLSTWIQALGDYDFKPINIDSASLQLRTLLSDKKALLVVDDVWHPDHVEPFRVAGGACRVLVTTREAPVNGAIRYDLDVMTLNQSLELLTACFNNELTNQELDYAETLAKTVGYLPLALELAAAQVRDGISWEELLSELEAEIANLEALDRLEPEEEPSDAKRKNYSLVASFNLSLKRLSPERLKKFAWLGVLPEDVTITETMATTLWNCTSFQAKKTLRYLRQKSLLLPGVSSTQDTNYRLHDLLHDLARNLLQPELGLSIPEAHQQLLERYQTKTENGLWHTLPDDGYIYNHLTWHLEKAHKIDDIHQLLKEETPAGDNGWYSQCDRQGKTANFVKDVSRAWAIAAGNFTENPTKSISLQCRYALITTSLNSLAGNIPPRLMAALVENKIWTAAQALAYVRQSQDSRSKVYALKAISKYLPPSLLPEALDCAKGLSSEEYQALALEGLASDFQEVLPQALDCARRISDQKDRAKALQSLGRNFREVLPEALEATRGISDQKDRADALIALAPHLPETLLPQALDCTRRISNEKDRAKALQSLGRNFREVLPEALEATRGISNQKDRADALIALAPHLPDVLPEALNAAIGISDKRYSVQALIDLAPHLPQVWLAQALDFAKAIRDEYDRANFLKALALRLPESFLPKALEAVIDISDESDRVYGLIGLAPHLPQVLLYQAFDCIRALGDESHRAYALIRLAPYLPDVLPEALDCTKAIWGGSDRADALIDLAPYLPEVLPEALNAARGILDEKDRADALIDLAHHLPEVLPEALNAARWIGDKSQRADALIGLTPHLPELLPQALDCVRMISDEFYRAQALIPLAPHLPDLLLPKALNVARGIGDKSHRADVLIRLAPHFPEVIPEVLGCARAIRNEKDQAGAFIRLIPHFPEVLPEALDYARALEDESHRANALQSLARHLPETLLPKALDCARGLSDEKDRGLTLVALAPHLSEVLPEALDCARGLSDEKDRADALIRLIPHLPEVLPEALKAARALGDKCHRADALIRLIPHLPEVLLEALEAARALEDKCHRARALIDLAPHFPEVLLEALEAFRVPEIKGFLCVSELLFSFYLDLVDLPEVLPEALDCAIAFESESARSSVLQALAPHLPQGLLPKALEAARAIGSEQYRVLALEDLIKSLTPSSVDCPLWQQILDSLASLNRSNFLKALPKLAPLIIKFGGVEALKETVAAVDDVSRWWK